VFGYIFTHKTTMPATCASRKQDTEMPVSWGAGVWAKTAAGKARIAAAHTVSGQETKAARLDRSNASARLSQYEDAMHVLGMTNAPRSRGRKARDYVPVETIEDVKSLFIDEALHPVRGVFRRQEKIKT
jgi:hypothetical protein